MAADGAQERNVEKFRKPLVVVDHHGIRGSVTERKVSREHPPDARLVGGDGIIVEQRPRLVAKRGIPDLRGAATHENDGLVTASLHVPQKHDRDHAADMEAWGRAIETDVADDRAGCGLRVEGLRIGALVHEPAVDDRPQEFGSGTAHDGAVCRRSPDEASVTLRATGAPE